MPVFALVPGDLGRRVDFDGHDLGDTTALEDDDEGTDTAALSASFLAALDICEDMRIADVVARYDVSGGY